MLDHLHGLHVCYSRIQFKEKDFKKVKNDLVFNYECCLFKVQGSILCCWQKNYTKKKIEGVK